MADHINGRSIDGMPADHIMISFDVKSLFNRNVTRQLVTDFSDKHYTSNLRSRT